MKPKIQLAIAALFLLISLAAVPGATNYWDLDGATAGAGGATPAGIWDTGVSANWSTDSAGAVAGVFWTPGNDAVFSAGTDATGSFAVTVDTSQTAGTLTVEEGTVTFSGGTSLNIGGGVAGKGIITIGSGVTSTIAMALEGGDDTGQITKVGAGTLVLSSANASIGGPVVVTEGTLQFSSATALGSTLSPTIVSNGAALRTTSTTAVGEPVILSGTGVGNTGALRCTGSAPPQANGWSGGATLTADARINLEASGTWTWTAKPIVGTNLNLTIGGNGGSFRCNVAVGNRTFLLGDGTLTKEGGCELRLETPNHAGVLNFNGGHILSRSTGGFMLTSSNTPTPIYVGAGAGQFRTGSAGPSYAMANDVILAAGANPIFNPDTTFTITCNGVISGAGGLTKSKGGTLVLNTNNTYTSNTTITAGTLVLGATGSISNSPVIEVRSGATLDASAVPGGIEVAATHTLKGAGTIVGNVTANGTISPGSSVGTLTFNNDLVIAGNLVIELNKFATPPNDLISVAGTLTNAGTGTITVTNIGPHLTTNDVFQIFNQPLPNGDALTIVSSADIVLTNKLAVDGTIGVVSAPPPVVPTNFNVNRTGPLSYNLTAAGGTNSTYFIFATTNIALPIESWWILGGSVSDVNGLVQFTDTLATNDQRYYRIGQ